VSGPAGSQEPGSGASFFEFNVGQTQPLKAPIPKNAMEARACFIF
jgi:hypothetical protein